MPGDRYAVIEDRGKILACLVRLPERTLLGIVGGIVHMACVLACTRLKVAHYRLTPDYRASRRSWTLQTKRVLRSDGC
jgi:hypothetical protein